MTFTLTPDQLAFLRTQPPKNGTRVPLALKMAGGNQRELAEHIRMWPGQLSTILSNAPKGEVRLSTLWRICDVFGVGVDDLFPRPVAAATRAARQTAKANTKPTRGRKNGRSTNGREKAVAA